MPSANILQKCYDEILVIDRENDDAKIKLALISNVLTNQSMNIMGLYRQLTDQKDLDTYQIDYNHTEADFNGLLTAERDEMVRITILIALLQYVFYRILALEGNYEFHLRGEDEMQYLKENIDYYIIRSIKNEQNITFHAFFLIYALGSLFTSHQYVGIDFEYTNKQIQLAQMNFEHQYINTSFIMIVAPPELDQDLTEQLIETIYCNPRIRKILHGSDSLDIPYLYGQLLGGDTTKIISFMSAMMDSRLLCEYYKNNLNDPSNNKCAIYDPESARSAVYYFGLVNSEQQERLRIMFDELPPHDVVVWNVHRMPSSQVRYAQYDVFYLKYFCYRITAVASKGVTNEDEFKAIYNLYMEIIPELTRFTYLENSKVTNLRIQCKEEVDPCNNYYIKKDGRMIKMIDIYNTLLPNLSTTNPPTVISKLTLVAHFKLAINTLIKRLIYGHISRKCTVSKDRENLWREKLDNQFIIDYFAEMGFTNLEKIFTELNTITARGVARYCSK
jgi:hypothetical protein